MALVKIETLAPNIFERVGDKNIINFPVYAGATQEKIGIVNDILVDEKAGRLRYLIIDVGFWIFGKKILLPVGLARTDFTNQCIYAQGLTKEQAKNLPELNDDLKIDRHYEQQVRNIYRPTPSDTLVNPVAPVAAFDPMAINTAATLTEPLRVDPGFDLERNSFNDRADDAYSYHNELDLYELNSADAQELKLYEEQLGIHKRH